MLSGVDGYMIKQLRRYGAHVSNNVNEIFSRLVNRACHGPQWIHRKHPDNG